MFSVLIVDIWYLIFDIQNLIFKIWYLIREAKSGGARSDLSTELRSIDFWRGVCVECLASFLYVLLVMTIMIIKMRVVIKMMMKMMMTGHRCAWQRRQLPQTLPSRLPLARLLFLSNFPTFTFSSFQLHLGLAAGLALAALTSVFLPASGAHVSPAVSGNMFSHDFIWVCCGNIF